jgi:phosphoribosylaminoimidazole-succinocarboxamide synthase
MVEKKELLYEGKAKKVYRTEDPNFFIIKYKEDATAFDGKKKGTIRQKGFYNNQITARIFTYLKKNEVENHFVELLGDREQLVKSVKIIPVEVIVRNIAAGSMAKRLGLEEGTELKKPVLEFCYKSDPLGDPMINDDHILALELASQDEIDFMKKVSHKVNELLRVYFEKAGLILVDFKLEFGRSGKDILLADEISPDTCRLWDVQTRNKLDKDRFRRDLGEVEEAYQEVLKRLEEVNL